MPTLNKRDILDRMYHPKDNGHKLVVTPILDEEAQITGPGIDLRLSNQFIVFKHNIRLSLMSGNSMIPKSEKFKVIL